MNAPLSVVMIVAVIGAILAAIAVGIATRRSAAARREVEELRVRCEEVTGLLERTRAAAEEAIRARSLFLANMSHEVREPLHAIIEYSALAADSLEADEEAGELTGDIKRIGAAGRHLLAVIDGVLELSRSEAGRTRLVVESFDVAAAVREVADAAAPLVAANSNVFDLRCDERLGVMRSDPAKLRQILLNLLSNAGKFARDGHVTLAAERSPDGAWIAFEVRDDGAGMSAEQQRTLFSAFSAGPGGASPAGLGLGLALSRRFCALMGGDIEVRSTAGLGSTFTVRLPAELPEYAVSGVFIAAPAPAQRPVARLAP